MHSTNAYADWEQKHRDVVQRLSATEGEVERKLAAAAKNLARGRRELPVDPDLALIAVEAAIVSAADALLRQAGYRIRGKTGSHAARFEFPGLPPEFLDQTALLRRVRDARNTALYDEPDRVPAHFAREVLDTAERMIEAARRKLANR